LTALAALDAGVDLDRAEAVAQIASGLDVEFGDRDGAERILLAGRDVTASLRTERCGDAASKVAAHPAVRAALLERYRSFARPPGLVADGGDMGTVVFPNAPVKVFLTASA